MLASHPKASKIISVNDPYDLDYVSKTLNINGIQDWNQKCLHEKR